MTTPTGVGPRKYSVWFSPCQESWEWRQEKNRRYVNIFLLVLHWLINMSHDKEAQHQVKEQGWRSIDLWSYIGNKQRDSKHLQRAAEGQEVMLSHRTRDTSRQCVRERERERERERSQEYVILLILHSHYIHTGWCMLKLLHQFI